MMLDINFEAITHFLGTWIISEPWVRVRMESLEILGINSMLWVKLGET